MSVVGGKGRIGAGSGESCLNAGSFYRSEVGVGIVACENVGAVGEGKRAVTFALRNVVGDIHNQRGNRRRINFQRGVFYPRNCFPIRAAEVTNRNFRRNIFVEQIVAA